VLVIPGAFIAALLAGAVLFVGTRWYRQRKRVRELERLLASDR
jgi:hypothetical protein